MATRYTGISPAHAAFITRQHLFFASSAANGTAVNVSPKSTDMFRVLGPNTVAYLDRTGSGNETAAHIEAGGRITIMFCAFEGAPLILRLYGRGTLHGTKSTTFEKLVHEHYQDAPPSGTRQIITIAVDMVQTSCGFGVPLYTYRGERDALTKWTDKKGEAGIIAHWRKDNVISLDGAPIHILEQNGIPPISETERLQQARQLPSITPTVSLPRKIIRRLHRIITSVRSNSEPAAHFPQPLEIPLPNPE